jgi:predicted ATPase
MRITRLELENFRCFKKADFDLGRITVLCGANSSGKSSVIYALLAVAQTENFPFELSLNGDYINLGGFKNIIHNNDSSKYMYINISTLNHFEEVGNIWSTWEYSKINGLTRINELVFNNTYVEVKVHSKSKGYNVVSTLLNRKLLRGGDLFNFFGSVRNDSFELNKYYDLPVGHRVVLKQYTQRNGHSNDNYKSLNSLDELFMFYSLHQLKTSSNLSDNEYISDYFLNYISSSRHSPARMYHEKALSNKKIGKFGEGFSDQILDWNTNDKTTFNNLLDVLKQLEILYSIDTKRQGNGGFDLQVKSKPNSKLLSIEDVGFGISQFLPIIVADLQMDNNSLLMISQPEIHLHPSVQAKFGDYLVNSINSTEKNYIVETHSEYLLMTLLCTTLITMAPKQLYTRFTSTKMAALRVHLKASLKRI